jgi:UDP-glucose 6-dehydrogenase
MNKNMTTSPCVGKAENDLSARQLIFHDEDWPVLYSAHNQLERQPNKTYERIVEIYCGKQNYDELHKKCFLFVGIGEQIGSMTTKNSPVLAIINYLEMEGAVVKKYDMFIEEYSDIPHMEHNSGLPRFDGIIIIHPYLISKWEQYSYATFFCRH